MAIVVLLPPYLHIVSVQNRVNDDLHSNDQSAYMNFARKAYDTHFHYTGGRARMPLFPWIQALFYSPEMSDEEFFQQGKWINVALSMVALAIIGATFFAKFSKLYAAYAVLVVAFLFLPFKAPWFQPEVLFCTLFALAIQLSIESIRHPRWFKSVGVGILFAVAHFTKASAFPAIVIYSGSFIVFMLSRLSRFNLSAKDLGIILIQAIAPALIFLTLLFPYFAESKARYGQYLYNVSTTFYMWYDSWAEVIAGARAAGDREGWPELPDDEIPSLGKYIAEHSVEDILTRLSKGSDQLINWVCKGINHNYGYCAHVGIGLVILAGALNFWIATLPSWPTDRDLQTASFVALLFTAYALASIWYVAIATGPRFILVLLIPLLWTIGLLVHTAPVKDLHITLKRNRVRCIDIIYAVMIVIVLQRVFQLAFIGVPFVSGGA